MTDTGRYSTLRLHGEDAIFTSCRGLSLDIGDNGTNLHVFPGIRQAEQPPTPDSFSEDMERDCLQEVNNVNEHDRGNPVNTLWNPGEFHDRLNGWEQFHDGSIVSRRAHHTRYDDDGGSVIEI